MKTKHKYKLGDIVTVRDFPNKGNTTDCEIEEKRGNLQYYIWHKGSNAEGFCVESQIIGYAPLIQNGFSNITIEQKLPTFNNAVDKTLNKCLQISNQRGGEYSDSWSLENMKTPFLTNILQDVQDGNFQLHNNNQSKRLIMLAAMCDVKLSRLIGPWKEDTTIDLINYCAAFTHLREEMRNNKV